MLCLKPVYRNLHADSHCLCVAVCAPLLSVLLPTTGQPLSSSARQRYFDKPSNLEGVVFDTEHVYTFVICQGIVDMPSYRCVCMM